MAKLALPSGIFQINEPILFWPADYYEPGDAYPLILVQPILAGDYAGGLLFGYSAGYQYCAAVDHANRAGAFLTPTAALPHYRLRYLTRRSPIPRFISLRGGG